MFLNFIFYLLGCRNSAVYYNRNLEMLYRLSELQQKRAAKEQQTSEMEEEIKEKLMEEYRDIDIDEYN